MQLINGRSYFWLIVLAGGLSYLGCSERTNVARNKGGDAGDGSGATAAAGSLGVAGNEDSAEAGSNGAGGTAANVGGTGANIAGAGDAGDATAGGGGTPNPYPNACSTLSLAPAVSYDIEMGGAQLRGLAAGDLDGDDKPDIVVTNTDGTASLLINKGDGSFEDATSIPSHGSIDVVIFDANGDQDLDLAFLNYSLKVGVALNKGGGVFDTVDDYTGTEGLASIAAGDVTGDGKADLAVSLLENGGVGILVNKGDGTFKDPVMYPTEFGNSGYTLALADFDGEKGLDVVAGPSGGVLLNQGDGTFIPTQYKDLEGIGPYVAAVDLNGDDLPDIVGAGAFRPNLDNKTFGAKVSYGDAGGGPPGRIVTADLLGRGVPDVVVPGRVIPNNGDGTFGTAVPFAFPNMNDGGFAVAAADFNGDDKLDIAVVSNTATDGLSVVLNTCMP